MQGSGWTKVHHPDYVDRAIEHIQRSWDTGEPWEDTFPLRGKDGNYRWFLSRALPIRDEQGNVVRWFGTHTDVTELREMANKITQQAEQLAEESRRKDEFLAMLSHECRVASRNFVTDCLSEDVTRRVADETLNGVTGRLRGYATFILTDVLIGNISGEATNQRR